MGTSLIVSLFALVSGAGFACTSSGSGKARVSDGSGGSGSGGEGGTATTTSTDSGGTSSTAGGAAGAAGGGGEAPVVEPKAAMVLVGAFSALADYEGEDIRGRAALVRQNGETTVSVSVILPSGDTAYPAHVHNMPCEQLGGVHYKIDPSIEDTEEDNEIWPAVETDGDGIGVSAVTVEHDVRGDALSVVIHDPDADNAKMACADLTFNEDPNLTGSGTFAAFAAAASGDESIEGTAQLQVDSDGTIVTLEVEGLDPNEEYAAHVHALPCGVMDAGAHYKIDPSIEDTDENNELWPSVMPDEDGMVSDELVSDHVARLDAQSVVIHRIDGDESPKVACADLTITEYPDVLTLGEEAVIYDAATDRGYDLIGAGQAIRGVDGTTVVAATFEGLDAGETYLAHLHALPCDVNAAGGHYKIDPSVEDTVEENEIWLPLDVSNSGIGETLATVEHVIRAEGQSIVVHDYDDSEKLACVDLDGVPLEPLGMTLRQAARGAAFPNLARDGEVRWARADRGSSTTNDSDATSRRSPEAGRRRAHRRIG